jgi:hypothetical protein
MQNDKDTFMESLICRLDDDCDKLLICKLDLECKKTLHFDSEVSMPRVSIYNLNHNITFFLPSYQCPENNLFSRFDVRSHLSCWDMNYFVCWS